MAKVEDVKGKIKDLINKEIKYSQGLLSDIAFKGKTHRGKHLVKKEE